MKPSGDPRLSLEDRYRSVDDYLERVREQIGTLVQAGYMLAEDADALLADCRQAYLDAVGFTPKDASGGDRVL